MLSIELLVDIAVAFGAVLGSVCLMVAAWKLVLFWSHRRADRTWSIDKLGCAEAGEAVSVEQPMRDEASKESPRSKEVARPKEPPKEEAKDVDLDDVGDDKSVVDLDDEVFDLDEAAPAEDDKSTRKKVVSFLV